MSTFDEFYSKNDQYYGSHPSLYLEMLIQRDKLLLGDALDLGCGDGRNSVFLAQNGFSVTAVDKSHNAIESLSDVTRRYGLNIFAVCEDISFFSFPNNKYSLIVANTILDHLEENEGNRVIEMIKRSLVPGGVVFVSVFTINDPGYTGLSPASETSVFVKRYFKVDELKNMFLDFTLLRYHEEEALDLHHGNPHYHNIARLIARSKIG